VAASACPNMGRQPACPSAAVVANKVRVQMAEVGPPYPGRSPSWAEGQVLYDGFPLFCGVAQVFVPDPVPPCGQVPPAPVLRNGQRAKPTIWKNRAGNTAVLLVKPLSIEDYLHAVDALETARRYIWSAFDATQSASSGHGTGQRTLSAFLQRLLFTHNFPDESQTRMYTIGVRRISGIKYPHVLRRSPTPPTQLRSRCHRCGPNPQPAMEATRLVPGVDLCRRGPCAGEMEGLHPW